ncbi:MAG: helix-turn-helix transcriptional regulator [Deltaproteobacteria bacterium]|nr:helix-turn-helix transcriptional regulator [Deltaproteobacteria bacterium]
MTSAVNPERGPSRNVLESVSCFDRDLVARTRRSLPDANGVQRAAGVFSALSDATRLRIALALHHGGEACVSDICHIVDSSASSVSQHLRRLREASVITSRREGKRIFFALRDPFVGGLVARLIDR